MHPKQNDKQHTKHNEIKRERPKRKTSKWHGKNHYLNECTNEKAIAKYKSETQNNIRSIQTACKFGDECRKHKAGTCKFRHETKTNQTEAQNQKKHCDLQ